MAQTRPDFVENIRIAMVDNSNYPTIAGQPMPSDMEDELTDSMARLANPIWDMVASWALGLEGDEFPDERVLADDGDTLPGFLEDKVDKLTLDVNTSIHKMYVKESPLATDTTRGGIMIGSQPFLFLAGSHLQLNAEEDPLLVGGNDMVPTSRAVKLYVDGVLTALGGGGDMLKSTYDTDDNGVVDDSERLDNQLPSYYLNWTNFTNTPTTIATYGITDAYTITEIDDFFEGEASGKKQVDWDRIVNPPDILTISNEANNRVMTSDGTSTGLNAEASLTFDGSTLWVDGDTEIIGSLLINGGVGTLDTGLMFGDGDTGIYEGVDDTLYFAFAGNQRYIFQSNGINFNVGNNRLFLYNVDPTGTQPVYTFNDDFDTGIGRNAADTLSLISGATEVMQLGLSGAIYLPTLGDDDTEDHVIAIDDTTGLLTKRSVASITSGSSNVTSGTESITGGSSSQKISFTDIGTVDYSLNITAYDSSGIQVFPVIVVFYTDGFSIQVDFDCTLHYIVNIN